MKKPSAPANSGLNRFLTALLFSALAWHLAPAARAQMSVFSIDGNTISAHFNQDLQAGSATEESNYTVYSKGPSASGINVTNATLLADNQTVLLQLDSPVGEFYAVGCTNLLAQAGNNPIAATATGYLGTWFDASIGTNNNPQTEGRVTGFFHDAFQIGANGSDISGTDDHCHYVYDKVTGNFETVANFTRLDYSANDAKACLMSRDSVAAGSRMVAVGFTPLVPGLNTNRVFMLARATANNAAFAFGAPPQLNSLGWLRLTRTNTVFRAYYGSNGVDWVQCGSFTNANFSNTQHVGVAVTSRDNGHDTVAAVNNCGIAGTRAGTGIVPTLGVSIVSNNVVAKWQRTPRDFTVQVTDNLLTSVGVSNPPPVWSYMLLPVFDTSLTGTNVFMPTSGRYMSIPMSFFSNSTMFVRLTQVERVIPDPLGVTPGLVLSLAEKNINTNNPGSTLGGYTVNPTNSVIVPITNYLTLSPVTNYTFTTENSTNLRTIMIVKRVTNIVSNVSIPVATNAGIGNEGLAKITLQAVATNYTVIIAATNKYTPSACNPLQLRIDFQ